MSIALTVLAEDQHTLTLGWTRLAGVVGYEFLLDGKRISNTWDQTVDRVKFGKPDTAEHTYEVVALSSLDSGSLVHPAVDPPPPPPPPPPKGGVVVYYDNDQGKAADWPVIQAVGGTHLICGADDPPSMAELQKTGGKAWAALGYFNSSTGQFSRTDADVLAAAKQAVAAYPGVIEGWYVADEPKSGQAAAIKARSDLLRSVLAVETVIAMWDTSIFAQFQGAVTAFAIDGYPNQDNFNMNDITSKAKAADALGIRYYGVLGAFTDGGVYKLPTPAQLQEMIDTWKATKQVGQAVYEWGPAGGAQSTWLQNEPALLAVLKQNYT